MADDGSSLLDVLRDQLDIRSVKDGCSPQGQCGCCTVWVDGAPRVACVTPVRRLQGRQITTLDGLPDEDRDRWVDALVATGGSQCGFCTPGIVMRLAALAPGPSDPAPTPEQVDRSLLAHLCRCTGWQTIGEAAELVFRPPPGPAGSGGSAPDSATSAAGATCVGRRPGLLSRAGSPRRSGQLPPSAGPVSPTTPRRTAP